MTTYTDKMRLHETRIREHFLVSNVPKGVQNLFNDFCPLMADDSRHPFVVYILSLVGMEIEGRELGFGFIVAGTGKAQGGIWDFKTDIGILRTPSIDAEVGLNLSNLGEKFQGRYEGYRQFRRMIRKLREELGGWIPGGHLEPVLLMDRHYAQKGVFLLDPTDEKSQHFSCRDAYCVVCRIPDVYAVQIKPAGTIRLFKEGKLFGQVMKLRDAGGWTTRHFKALHGFLKERLKMCGLMGNLTSSDASQTRKDELSKIILAFLSLSEKREGASLYVIPKARLVKMLNQTQGGDQPNRLLLGEDPKNDGDIVLKHRGKDNQDARIENMSDPELECYLRQDGAVIIDESAQLIGVGAYFHGSPGGRKRTAQWVVNSKKHTYFVEGTAGNEKTQYPVALFLSQDGTIYCCSPFLPWIDDDKSYLREDQDNPEFMMHRLDFLYEVTADPISNVLAHLVDKD